MRYQRMTINHGIHYGSIAIWCFPILIPVLDNIECGCKMAWRIFPLFLPTSQHKSNSCFIRAHWVLRFTFLKSTWWMLQLSSNRCKYSQPLAHYNMVKWDFQAFNTLVSTQIKRKRSVIMLDALIPRCWAKKRVAFFPGILEFSSGDAAVRIMDGITLELRAFF